MTRFRALLTALTTWAAPAGQLKRSRLVVALALAYGFFIASYLTINFYSVGREARELYLPWEANLPFIPEFEFLYLLGYLFPLVAVFRLPGPRELRQLLLAFLITLAVAYTSYLLFPVYLERPTLEVNSLATFLLSLEYKDPSYNHFPSLHVAASWLIYFGCRRNVQYPRAFLTLLIAMSFSTLFIKQHYLVDIIYGFALALAAWVVAGRIDSVAISSRTEPG